MRRAPRPSRDALLFGLFLPASFLVPVFPVSPGYPWGAASVLLGAVTLILGVIRWKAASGRKVSHPRIPLDLAAAGAVGLAVHLVLPHFPLAPLAFFLLAPFSVLSSSPLPGGSRGKKAWSLFRAALTACLPGIPLLSLGAGGLLFSSDPSLLVWSGGLFLFQSLLSLRFSLIRQAYEKLREKHDRIIEDSREFRGAMKGVGEAVPGDLSPDRREDLQFKVVRLRDHILHDLLRVGCWLFEARSAILFTRQEPGVYRIRAAIYSREISEQVVSGEFPEDRGLVHLILEREEAGRFFCLHDASPGEESLPFYRPGVEVHSLAAKVIRRRSGILPAAAGEGPPWGVLYLDSPHPNAFPEGERTQRLMEVFARLLEQVADLTEDLFRAVEGSNSAGALLRCAKSLSQTLEPKDIAFVVAQTLYQVAPNFVEAVAVLVNGPQGLVEESVEGNAALFEGFQGRLRESVLVSMAAEQLKNHYHDSPEGPGFLLVAGKRLPGVVSMAALSVSKKEGSERTLLAVLLVVSTRPQAFPEIVRKNLESVADLATLAFTNAFNHERVREESRRDGLTGLLNHRTFQSILERKISEVDRSYEKRIGVLMADVDHFKKVNDAHGHPVGDEVLREMARRLKGSVRTLDTVARYGGEEFAVILDQVDGKKASEVAEKIRTGVGSRPFTTKAGPLDVTVSIGWAVFGKGMSLPQRELLDRADRALYQAKQQGRDRCVGFPHDPARDIPATPGVDRRAGERRRA